MQSVVSPIAHGLLQVLTPLLALAIGRMQFQLPEMPELHS